MAMLLFMWAIFIFGGNTVASNLLLDKCNNSKCILKQNGQEIKEAPFDCFTYTIEGRRIKGHILPTETSGSVPSNTSKLDITERYVDDSPDGCKTEYVARISLPTDGTEMYLEAYQLTVTMANQPYTGQRAHVIIKISSHNVSTITNRDSMTIEAPCFTLFPEGSHIYATLQTYPKKIGWSRSQATFEERVAKPLKRDIYNVNNCVPKTSNTYPEDTSTSPEIFIYVIVAIAALVIIAVPITMSVVCFWRRNKQIQRDQKPEAGDPVIDNISHHSDIHCSLIGTHVSFPKHQHSNRSASIACTQCALASHQDRLSTLPRFKHTTEQDLHDFTMGHHENSWFDESDDDNLKTRYDRQDSGHGSGLSSETIEC